LLRDARSGLEYLRNAHGLHESGIELELRAYQALVFLDPEEVVDGPARDWSRLAWRIGLSGVPDLRRALDEQLLEPVRTAVSRLVSSALLRKVAGAGLAATGRGARRGAYRTQGDR
jgi:hypothetical protein